MKLVVDANILFAALIKKDSTAELLLNDKLHLIAPEFLFEEFAKYKELVLKKTHRSNKDFNNFLDLLRDRITIVPKRLIMPFINEASQISPDPKDSIYLALAIAFKSDIWSNDNNLKKAQDKITVLSTSDLIKKTNFLNI